MAHKRVPGLFFESDRSHARTLDPKKYKDAAKKVEQKKVKIIKKQEKSR